jgi:hypothetical protein
MAMADGVKGDMTAHEATYGRFLVLLKYGAVLTFVIAAVVVLIIAS